MSIVSVNFDVNILFEKLVFFITRKKRKENKCFPQERSIQDYILLGFESPLTLKIINHFEQRRPLSIILYGAGGMGKTRAAFYIWSRVKQHGRRKRRHRRRQVLIWVEDKGDPLYLARHLTECLLGTEYVKKRLDVAREAAEDFWSKEILHAIKRFYEREGGGVYITIDNVSVSTRSFIENIMPSPTVPFVLVVTSRVAQPHFLQNFDEKIEIKVWDDKSIDKFFKMALGDDILKLEADSFVMLKQCLKGMPLALSLAAGKIKFYQRSGLERPITRFVHELQQFGCWDTLNVEHLLESVLEVSYDVLNDKEKEVFRYLGMFADSFNVEDVFQLFKNRFDRKFSYIILEKMVSISMLQYTKSEEVEYSMHDWVRWFALHKLREAGERDQALKIFTSFLQEVFKDLRVDKEDDLRRGLRLETSLVQTIDESVKAGDMLGALRLLYAARLWLDKVFFRHKEWLAWLNEIEKSAEINALSGKQKLLWLSRLFGMRGDILLFLDKYKDAIRAYEQALEMLKRFENALDKVQGESERVVLLEKAHHHFGIGRARSKLSPETALSFYNAALSVYEKVGDVNQTARSLQALGELYRMLGEFIKAKEFYEKALDIYHRYDSLSAAVVLKHLGQLYHNQGDLDTAKTYYQKALQLKGESILLKGYLYRLLGDIASKQGKFEEAMALYNKSLKIALKLNDRLGEALVYQAYGNMKKYQGDYASAVEHLKRSIQILEEIDRVYPYYHVRRALAEVLAKQERFDEALIEYERILNADSSVGDLLQARIYREIAELIWLPRENHKRAEEYLRRACLLYSKGETIFYKKRRIECLCLLTSAVYERSGQLTKAGQTGEQALKLAREINDDLYVKWCEEILGRLCRKMYGIAT